MRPRAEMTAPATGGGYAPYPCWAGGMSGVGAPVFGAGLAWAAPGCGCGYAAVCSSGAGCGGVPGAGACVVSVGSGGPEPLCVSGPLGGVWSPVRGGSFGGADAASRWLVSRWGGFCQWCCRSVRGGIRLPCFLVSPRCTEGGHPEAGYFP